MRGARLLLSTLVLLLGCPDDDPATEEADTDGLGFEGPGPMRDGWQTVVDQPMPTDGSVTAVRIGGTAVMDNFVNRGDVIVRYADTDRITVELRRFTFAGSDPEADDDFDRLQAWAYVGGGTPQRPDQMDPDDACIDAEGVAPWRDGCHLRVYYDGLVQPLRAGADMRVTLPRAYVYGLDVVTEDDIADADYQNRGNVCIEDLPGSATVQLGAGQAWVSLADELQEMPACSDVDLQACRAAAWNTAACPCLADQLPFGTLTVESGAGMPADITLDAPSDRWTRLLLRNEDVGLSASNPLCTIEIATDEAELYVEETIDLANAPWVFKGGFNQPPAPPAIAAGGYAVNLRSARCEGVAATENPEDFVGQGQGAMQPVIVRGQLSVCTDCLDGVPCEALLPGGP